jgi:hypothetical protein
LFNTNAGQIDLQGPFVHDNPVSVLEFEWAPLVEGQYIVEYTTFSRTHGDHDVNVWINKDSYDLLENWQVTEAHIAFQVIPAPGVLCVFGASFIIRRRRRT